MNHLVEIIACKIMCVKLLLDMERDQSYRLIGICIFDQCGKLSVTDFFLDPKSSG